MIDPVSKNSCTLQYRADLFHLSIYVQRFWKKELKTDLQVAIYLNEILLARCRMYSESTSCRKDSKIQ